MRHHMQIYVSSLVHLPLLYWLKTQFLESNLMAEKMFQNEKFPGFGLPYELFKYFENKAIDSNNTL